MAYIDGFVIAVLKTRRQEFIDHAENVDRLFLDYGATAVVECWEDDVPAGSVTDFRRAVQATPEEAIVFSWITWPDKATRDAGFQAMAGDERMAGPMPFDGKRMIMGGFVPVVEFGS